MVSEPYTCTVTLFASDYGTYDVTVSVPGNSVKCSTPSPSVYGSGSSTTSPYVYWSAVTGASSYYVEIDGYQYSTSSTSYSLSSTSKGTYHTVRVMACGSGNYSNSDWSSAVGFYNSYCSPISSPTITATANSSSQITVTLGTVSYASSYELQWATTSNFSDAKTATLDTNRQCVFTGLSPNTTYYFRSKAYTTQSYYANSSYRTASCKTLKIPLDTPVLNVDTNNDTSISLSWTHQPEANKFIVEYSTSSNFSNKKTITITS